MDPFTFGIAFVGTTGGTLLVLSLLEKKGVSINTGYVKFVAETAKYGALLSLVIYAFKLFI